MSLIYQLIESTNIKGEAANTEETNTSKSTKQVIIIKYTPKKQTKEASPVAKKSAAAAVLTVKSDAVRQSNEVEDATTLLAAPMSSATASISADETARFEKSTRIKFLADMVFQHMRYTIGTQMTTITNGNK